MNNQVERVLKIWEERRVYEKEFVEKLRALHGEFIYMQIFHLIIVQLVNKFWEVADSFTIWVVEVVGFCYWKVLDLPKPSYEEKGMT